MFCYNHYYKRDFDTKSAFNTEINTLLIYINNYTD